VNTLLIADGREIAMPVELARVVAAAGLESISSVAQVLDADLSPALLLISGGELVLATRRGVRRWTPGEVKRVEADEIVLVNGPAIRLGGWGAASERSEFRSAVARWVRPHADALPALPSASDQPAPESNAELPVVDVEELRDVLRMVSARIDIVLVALGLIACLVATSSVPQTSCYVDPEPDLGTTYAWLSIIAPICVGLAALTSILCRRRPASKIGAALGYGILAFVVWLLVSLGGAQCAFH
jgi:hypothetical protein